jgi:hypothetical protein
MDVAAGSERARERSERESEGTMKHAKRRMWKAPKAVLVK